QGVGFRRHVERLAKSLGITGFVKNEADGSVFVVAEAETEEKVGLLVSKIGKEKGIFILIDVKECIHEEKKQKARPEYHDFEIRYD
ncbi:acylphosphatase, partial [Candidatus Parvarchaeota archaeon]|nr:acylphosphatase [Candidatus Parvarchaeota archaeon]